MWLSMCSVQPPLLSLSLDIYGMRNGILLARYSLNASLEPVIYATNLSSVSGLIYSRDR